VRVVLEETITGAPFPGGEIFVRPSPVAPKK